MPNAVLIRWLYRVAYTLPTTPTPSVPPGSRVTSLTAAGLGRRGDAQIASVSPRWSVPMPVSRTTSCAVISV
ncbi:hypothetical protein TH66_01985 [Carbonactinospora thermoautotrophica]|uniref:Uncharacterized protein n=1 Tax=Carbonactinospora thermoautotrophica TaxID=1469144 RepID=A0A132NDJ3_9ACTN|nr:hypothetical protein [Carbonactinospora thermoautotrophica]KWX05482.1 hypothetical protein TH66_01985 [Carbonactinospora thermoautotrophica]KWX08047.1 hypothetical protein TR74_16710 [Carbonactinospora thermoautotrophica]